MISAFYSYSNICKNNQLDEFYNTTELIRFLRQFPELVQTGPHHFSNSKDFGHFISITLLYAAQQDSWSDKDTIDKEINLIVVVSSSLNNAPFFVKPILLKISQHLNWQLYCDDDKDEDKGEDKVDDNYSDGANMAPFRRLDDENDDDDDDDDKLNHLNFRLN
jgi:hypothetical protein